MNRLAEVKNISNIAGDNILLINQNNNKYLITITKVRYYTHNNTHKYSNAK